MKTGRREYISTTPQRRAAGLALPRLHVNRELVRDPMFHGEWVPEPGPVRIVGHEIGPHRAICPRNVAASELRVDVASRVSAEHVNRRSILLAERHDDRWAQAQRD